MVVHLYRWKLKPNQDNEFEDAWVEVTQYLRRDCGSWGSRLHFGDDGLTYSYAQWPSLEKLKQAKPNGEAVKRAFERMKTAIAESLPTVLLNPTRDLLDDPTDLPPDAP